MVSLAPGGRAVAGDVACMREQLLHGFVGMQRPPAGVAGRVALGASHPFIALVSRHR